MAAASSRLSLACSPPESAFFRLWDEKHQTDTSSSNSRPFASLHRSQSLARDRCRYHLPSRLEAVPSPSVTCATEVSPALLHPLVPQILVCCILMMMITLPPAPLFLPIELHCGSAVSKNGQGSFEIASRYVANFPPLRPSQRCSLGYVYIAPHPISAATYRAGIALVQRGPTNLVKTTEWNEGPDRHHHEPRP
ncbi:hypothetical protein B0H15DRAFT_440259 [Mycena belliarum]|uniref:Uncharacterized protein n=1 Tax=Mycena belliarum TaxID=1033014 RepID=A0AAD6U2E3_9AGAR|nr:hypothetical protein B0H15DRAFT_440259 [Mycena belliae]